jgi:hypothetical protein
MMTLDCRKNTGVSNNLKALLNSLSLDRELISRSERSARVLKALLNSLSLDRELISLSERSARVLSALLNSLSLDRELISLSERSARVLKALLNSLSLDRELSSALSSCGRSNGDRALESSVYFIHTRVNLVIILQGKLCELNGQFVRSMTTSATPAAAR